MTGFISLDADTGRLRITFPYDPDLVELVRTLPGRRWDRQSKTWLVPQEAASQAVDLFRPRNFTFAPEVLELAGLEEEDPSPRGESAQGALTVSQLNHMAQAALAQAFPRPLWVVGEVNRLRESARGQVYLELVEKAPQGEGIAARVAGILFQEEYLEIREKLLAAGGLVLSDDLEVRVLVRVDLYAPRGSYQVRILDIDPYFTLGRLAARREEILARLKELGLLEKNRNLPWPPLPLRVALVTSWDSNAFHDFTGVLRASGFAFQVDVFDARVQGRELEGDVLAALDWFARRADRYDLLVIIRGGGSASDLAWFDNLQVALAVARHPLKILVGIGHTLDRTVLDEIAASARTPTEAGEFLVGLVQEEAEGLEDRARRILEEGRSLLQGEKDRLRDLAGRTARALRSLLRGEEALLEEAARRIGRGTLLRLNRERGLLREAASRIGRIGAARIAAPLGELPLLGARIGRAARGRIRLESERLAQEEKKVSLLDPRRILERGYALVRDEAGRIVKRAARVRPGDSLEIQMSDGSFPVKAGGEDGFEEEG